MSPPAPSHVLHVSPKPLETMSTTASEDPLMDIEPVTPTASSSRKEKKRKRAEEATPATPATDKQKSKKPKDTPGTSLDAKVPSSTSKGKRKEVEDVEMEELEVLGDFSQIFTEIQQEEDEEEVIFEMSTKAEKTIKQWNLGAEEEWWPKAFYDNHEEPFAMITGGAAAIQELIRAFPHPVLVAAAGKWANEKKRKLMEKAIRFVFADKGKELELQVRELGDRNAWTLFGLPSKAHVKKLVAQEAVYNSRMRQLVTFRAIRGTANLTRAFLITKVNKEYIEIVRRYLEKDVYKKRKISMTTPGINPGLDKGEVLVVVQNRNKEEAKVWAKPDHIPRMKGPEDRTMPKLETRSAPHCVFCHSNHHTYEACPWKTSLGFEIDPTYGEK